VPILLARVQQSEKPNRKARQVRVVIDALLEAMGEAALVIDPAQQRILGCNSAFRSLATTAKERGIPPGSGMPGVEHDDWRELCRLAEGVAQSGGLHRGQIRLHPANGAPVDCSLAISPLGPVERDPDIPASHTGASCALVRLAPINATPPSGPGSLHEDSAFRAIAESITDAVVTIDAASRIVYANPGASRALGYAPGTLEGRSITEIMPQELRERHRAALAHYQETGIRANPDVNLEFPVVRADGSRFDAEISFGRYRANHEDYFTGVIRDITERRALIDELGRSEERFRYVARAIVDAVWDWDFHRDTVWWGEGFERLFGHAAESVTTATAWAELIHPEDREQALRTLAAVTAGGEEHWEQSYRFRRADGSYAHVEASGFILRDRHGRATRMVGGTTDVTEHVRMQERLRQAQRIESLGRLTGGVAHDFNNLLTVIMGSAESLAAGLGDSAGELRTQALAVQRAAERAAELTHRLLAFARRQALDPKVVDVNALIGDLEGLLRRTLGAPIDIRLTRAGDLCNALIDPGELENAILNLAINARDAMPRGGQLTIETRNQVIEAEDPAAVDTTPGEYVAVIVSDTGEGIAAEHIAQVFEPFFTTKAVGRGTGLGLSMVHGFARQSGGQVRIYSEPGQGTTVRLYLPVAPPDEGVTPGRPVDDSVPRGEERILLVEDDPLVRTHTLRCLESLGYSVTAVADGEAAVGNIDGDGRYALLLTDVVLTGQMSGRHVAEAATERDPALRVLYMSGYSENAIIHGGRLDPGVRLLSKPFRLRELARKVRDALDD